MLSSALDSLGVFLRPMAIALFVLVGLGFISNPPGSGGAGMSCRPLTDNIELNRALCRMNPARIWNTPVADLIPGLRSGAPADDTAGVVQAASQ